MIPALRRRELLLAFGATGVAGGIPRPLAHAESRAPRLVVSLSQFGGKPGSGGDDTVALQKAIDTVESRGGGTVLIAGRYRCGNIIISGRNVTLQGENGWLVDGRLTIAPTAANISVADLGLLDTTGDRRNYLMNVAGRDCRFSNVQLVKDPIAAGLQMYLRQSSSGCRFTGLRLKGSNGIMIMGKDHLFEDFELESMMLRGGGDDAFAIDALDSTTENITIRNGIVRGFGAIISFGSAIGSKRSDGFGSVRNVKIDNIEGDRCTRLAFFKPSALDYEFRNGVVENVMLRNLVLNDPAGRCFRTGIELIAARGATIRNVQATGITINARAMDHGVAPTSAIEIALLDKDAPAKIEDVKLQVQFTDPYSGAAHGANAPGYPVDHVVHVEKRNPDRGSIAGIVLDVEGRGCSSGGISIGAGLDGAVTVQRALLSRVSTDPPGSQGAGGIWSSSRVNLGEVQVSPVKGPKFGGPAFPNRGP